MPDDEDDRSEVEDPPLAEVILHPTVDPHEEFDEIPDLRDRRRLLVKLIFGVDVEDPDPIFEPDPPPVRDA